MAVALARSRAEATPSRTQAPAAVPVVQRTSRDSRRYGLSGRSIQPALRISAAHDPAEREAESVAARVARGGIGHAAPGLQRSPLLVQRQSPGAAGGVASPVVEARVRAAATGGSPLVPALRQTLEPRFRADFGGVRLHTDAKAAALATAIGARAFTFGNHIFFNAGQYQPQTPEGLELLAHELTHTIQQQAVIQRAVNDAPVIGERTAPQASRLGMSDALNYFADAANAIPGYRMFTILIGVNPINMNAVEASAANILRALVEFLPGGVVITRVLDSYGIFDRVGGWIEGQLKSLGITGAAIRAAVNAFMDGLSWRDIFALGSLWDRAKSIFTTPITRIIAFAKSLFGEILRFVREAVLRPLAALAEGTAGYGLLKAVIGFDPVTGEAVPRTAETIIGGFMTMIGQQELWENIKKANAIPRAWAWFQGALGGLMGLVRSIPERFMAALRGLEIMDFVVLPSAFVKLAKVFGGFLVDFGSWALGTVLNLLQIIVEVLAPGVMPYLRKAAGAFNTIIANPVRFVQTLVRAAVQGFKQFASRFLTHLQASLIGWLTGALGGAGLYLPKSLAPMELVKFVLSVLGLTWANIRGKLVAATSETVVAALETGFDIVKTLVTEGPASAWKKIVETLTNLKQMAIDAIMDFVKSKVVEAAITKLLSLLSPAGALIQAIIATYNTIMFFVERIRQIAQVAAAFIDGIAAIAAGNIAPAADRVEQTMAGLLTLVISFLARIAGLGKVADAVTGLIAKIRAPIDKALDKVVAWIVAQARKLGKMLIGTAGKPEPKQSEDKGGPINVTKLSAPGATKDGEGHTIYGAVSNGVVRLSMASSTEEQLDFVLTRLRNVCISAIKEYPNLVKSNPDKAKDIKETAFYLADVVNKTRPSWQGEGSIYVAIRAISEGTDKRWAGKPHAVRQAAAQEELRKTVSGMTSWILKGLKLGFTALGDLKYKSGYVDGGGMLKTEYSDVRANFYNFSWKGPAPTFLSSQLAELRKQALAIDPSKKLLNNPSRFYWSEDQTKPGSGYVADATDKANNGQPELDHVTPLGTRWSSGKPKQGNDSTHSERDKDYQNGLQVISKKLNGAKSGPKFIPSVGPNFRGPKDV